MDELTKVYARINEQNHVTAFLSTTFDEIHENDIFIDEGNGDDYSYPHTRFEVMDMNLYVCNYRIVEGKLIKRTHEEKQKEAGDRPISLTDTQILGQKVTDHEIRITKLELINMEGGINKLPTYEEIKEWYIKNWITDEQLDEYVKLGIITPEQADEIKRSKKL